MSHFKDISKISNLGNLKLSDVVNMLMDLTVSVESSAATDDILPMDLVIQDDKKSKRINQIKVKF